MSWIELHDTLPDHDKVLQVADALSLDKDMVVGKLVRLWTWALNNREDGRFLERDLSTIAEVMRFKGKPIKLVTALVEARLLDADEKGYIIHGWAERVGMLLAKREEARAKTRARVRKHRSKGSNGVMGTQDETLEAEPVMTDAELRNDIVTRYVTPNIAQSNAATIQYHTIPYNTINKKDDEDDEDDDKARACARGREAEFDDDEADYASIDCLVRGSYRAAYGYEPTKEMANSLSRIAIFSGKRKLIGEAITRAALHGAKSVVAYVSKIIDEWKMALIDTPDELARYEYLKDCINGRAEMGLEREEAIRMLDAMRCEKRCVSVGENIYAT